MLNFSISELAYQAFTTNKSNSMTATGGIDFKDTLLASTKTIENTSNQSQNSYDKYNKDDTKIDKKEPVEKDNKDNSHDTEKVNDKNKTEKPDDTTKKDTTDKTDETNKSEKTDESEKTDKTEKTDKSENDANEKDTSKEQIQVSESQVIEIIAQSLQITAQELTAIMDELNINLEDMVENPQLLDKLINEVHSVSEIFTNKDLMNGIVNLRDMFNNKYIKMTDSTENVQVIDQAQTDTLTQLTPKETELEHLRSNKQNKDLITVDETIVQVDGDESITQQAITDVSKEIAKQAPRQEAKIEQHLNQQSANTTNTSTTTTHTTTDTPSITTNTMTSTAITASKDLGTNTNTNQQGSNSNNNLMNMNVNIEAMASKLRGTNQATNLHNTQNTQTPRMQTPIATQIIDKIQVVTLTDGSQITVDLDPRELGRLSLTVTENSGIVKADIKVESEKVKEMVLEQLDSLKQSLEEKGVTISEFSVDVRDQGFNSQMEQGKSKSQRRIQELLNLHLDGVDEEDLTIEADELELAPTQIRHDQNVNVKV
ncbi:hypothetical protein AN642_00835 [Epulopiscium sp. SCG-B10WGA-EpuloA2]|nr:hypothetical protein AN642_00835 [Epulopiscium sp. SCG-B10WGA-EpuloA2]